MRIKIVYGVNEFFVDTDVAKFAAFIKQVRDNGGLFLGENQFVPFHAISAIERV